MTHLPDSKGTILIVDDEPNVLWFISKVCQPMGYMTVTAGNGIEALKIIQECGHKLDLVLLDLKMPGMGGLEVLRSIRRYQPTLPVIVLTAIHDKQEECERLGVEEFIKKPYSLEELYNRIEHVIDRQSFDKLEAAMDPGVIPAAKLLIVDEDTEVCELLSAALFEDFPHAQFTIKWTRTGEEALRLSQDFEPDIVILDIKLPHMWGDELVRRFKAGEGRCPRDFVIYTSLGDLSEIDRAQKLGYKFLSKPTDLDTLFEVLAKICLRHHLVRKQGA
ncbi:MAG: response regulator [Candidatus Omnitrophica bacterium]|nr:response regulator [Candidatus Omnitrophota bacterium]